MAPRVFIGVVTHDRSRFKAAATTQLEELAVCARTRGWDVTTEVNSRNDYSPDRFPLTRGLVLRSAVAQARLEHRWRRYLAHGERLEPLAGSVRWARDAALLVGTTAARTVRYVGPWPFAPADTLAGADAVVRLLNIDLAHLALLREAGGADWAIILEDDARADSSSEAMDALLDAFESLEGSPVAFINASRSIGHDELGVVDILEPPADGRRMARVPVTNTVCAVAYSAGMLAWLPTSLEAAGLVPVVPIDWRLNRVVMEAWADGRLGPKSCVWLDPAPFVQGSMH